MKKTAIILLLAAYTASVLGISVKEFYCCGKYVSSSLQVVATEKQHCSMETEDSGGCCQTKYQFHKVSDNHSGVAFVILSEKNWKIVALPVQEYQGYLFVAGAVLTNNNIANAPPPLQYFPLYSLHCNFRI